MFLARMDALHMLRRRETQLWTFLMPIVFFYFIGTITGGFGGGSVQKETIAVQVPADAGFLVDQLAKRLEERGYQVSRVAGEARPANLGRVLEIPSAFTESVQGGKPVKLRFTGTGNGMGANYDEVRVARAVYSLLADLAATESSGEKVTPEALSRLAQKPRTLTLKVEAAGKRQKIPTGFEQAIPGTMVMFTLLIMFTSGGISLFTERRQGLLRRLASSPMSRGTVVLGKWGARMILGVIQIVFAMLAGSLLFRVDWGPHLGVLFAVLLAYGALAATLGILLGNFGRSEGQIVAMGVISTNILAALGGCWWPIEITPRWTQALALFLPTGWAMDAMHKLVSFGYGPAAVAPHFLGMGLAALLAGAVVARTFRFQ